MWKKTPVVVEAWLSALRVGALACLRVQGQVIGVALSGTASLLKVDTSCMEDGRKCRAQLDRSRESYFNPPKSKKPCLEVLWILVGRRLTRWENTDSPDQDISLLLQKEMLMYEQESPIPAQQNPLMWWKTLGSGRYPHVAQMAKKYLSILGSSVRSERVFSSAGNIVNKKRSALAPSNVDYLVFLTNNL